MRRSLWVMLGIAMAGILTLTIVSQSMVRQATGVDDVLLLQGSMRASWPGVFADEPPLLVMKIPPSEEWPGWRWRVEATLRPEVGSPADQKATLERLVLRALTTELRGTVPVGVMVVLHRSGMPDWTMLYDAGGRPVVSPGPGPRPQEPPHPPAPPSKPPVEEDR